ncbi:MAG: ABC transporter ATP-binding protein [Verrucomicrobiota bacterium]
MNWEREIEALPPSKLIVEEVSKNFTAGRKRVEALEKINFQVNEGEFVCIVGPSGCGKSSLLSIIAGLEFPDRGRVMIDDQEVVGTGRDRMVLFQESALFPWLNVFENVMFGLKLKPGLTNPERARVAEYYLKLVGLEKFSHAHVHELSGGMKQRAALARALAPNPTILLMDEPFASLDAITRAQFYEDLQKIWMVRKRTILFVTHNVREAACLGDRVFLFSKRPGRIREEFTIDLPRPREFNSPEVASHASRIMHALKGYVGEAGDTGE